MNGNNLCSITTCVNFRYLKPLFVYEVSRSARNTIFSPTVSMKIRKLTDAIALPLFEQIGKKLIGLTIQGILNIGMNWI